MYGLFKYTYDHYEWEDLGVVSEDIDKLKDYFKEHCNDSILAESEYEHERLGDGEKEHYQINKLTVLE